LVWTMAQLARLSDPATVAVGLLLLAAVGTTLALRPRWLGYVILLVFMLADKGMTIESRIEFAGFPFNLLDATMLGAAALLIWHTARRGSVAWPRTPLMLPLGAYVAAWLLSVVVGGVVQQWGTYAVLREVRRVPYFIVGFLCFSYTLRDAREPKVLMQTYLVCAAVVAFRQVLLFVASGSRGLLWTGYLVSAVPLLMVLQASGVRWPVVRLWLPLLALYAVALLCVRTRTWWAASFFGCVVFGVLAIRRTGMGRVLAYAVAAVAVVSVAYVCADARFDLGEAVLQRVSWQQYDTFGTLRLRLAASAEQWALIRERPVLGWGCGAATDLHRGHDMQLSSHNSYLEAWFRGGLPELLAMLWAVGALACGSYRTYRLAAGGDSWLGLACLCHLAGLFVASFTSYPFERFLFSGSGAMWVSLICYLDARTRAKAAKERDYNA